MKKIGVILLIALVLVPVLATPADAWRGGRGGGRHHGGGGRFAGGLVLGLGVGALLTAPWWYSPPPAYAYPVYTPYPVYPYPGYPPAYPAPVYSAPAYTPAPTYPTPEPVSSAPQGAMQPMPAPPSGSQPPAAQPPQVFAQNCQMVWIEGHYETRVTADGQRFTSWIPSYQQQVCQ